jgi:hypothetical protein
MSRRTKILLLLTVVAGLAALAVPAAWATSPHFIYANVTNVTTNSIDVSFKEAGLGNSLNSVTIQVNGTAECINPGSKHPKAANKESVSASGVFKVSNGQATGSLTLTASLSPPCTPPMEICWTDLTVTDAQFSDSTTISGTFCKP